jgi:hypothetical protein
MVSHERADGYTKDGANDPGQNSARRYSKEYLRVVAAAEGVKYIRLWGAEVWTGIRLLNSSVS